MKYVLLVYNTPGTFDALSEAERNALMSEFEAFNKELTDSGQFVGGAALADQEMARTVRVRDNVPATTDGPFAEAKEHLGGFYIVEVEDLDAALAWGAKTSECIMRPIEVRPFMHTDGA
jgi:hypothetical protein